MKTESFLLVTTTSPVRVVVRPWEEGKLRRGGGGGGDLEGFSVRYRGTVSSSASSGDLESGTHHHSVHKCSFLQERPRGQLRDGEEGRTPPMPATSSPSPSSSNSPQLLSADCEPGTIPLRFMPTHRPGTLCHSNVSHGHNYSSAPPDSELHPFSQEPVLIPAPPSSCPVSMATHGKVTQAITPLPLILCGFPQTQIVQVPSQPCSVLRPTMTLLKQSHASSAL